LFGMKRRTIYKYLTIGIGLVWFVNGFFCKLLHLVPRHELIVARILGPTYAAPLTRIIGLMEVGMAIWIYSRRMPRMNMLIQIMVISTMNALEYWIAPDMLLWGRANAVFAFLFILLIIGNEFYLNPKAGIETHSL